MFASNVIKKILSELGKREGFEIRNSSQLSGGNINYVFLLETSSGKQVLKLNESNAFPGMFEAEKKGLQTLKNTNTFDIPRIYGCGKIGDFSYLLLEYKEKGIVNPDFWINFAKNLAELHRNSAQEFGFPSSNYIGSLPQHNEPDSNPAKFYIEQRLKPQVELAVKKGFSFDNLEEFYENISKLIPQEAPALIHGDLWSGNYIINQQGEACLIDPATCFAPREMDLAMMKLFGGFPEKVFENYNHFFPLKPGFTDRIPIWQLYYLLVHLNLFGGSYLSAVTSIFQQFSKET